MTLQTLLRALLAALAPVLCAACVAFQPHRGVQLATSPPGARVYVDGRDTGFVTPCHLGLPNDRQRIDMELEGYAPTTVLVKPGGELLLIYWREAKAATNTWRFPLFLNSEDFLRPVKIQPGLEPRRIYVPLESTSE